MVEDVSAVDCTAGERWLRSVKVSSSDSWFTSCLSSVVSANHTGLFNLAIAFNSMVPSSNRCYRLPLCCGQQHFLLSLPSRNLVGPLVLIPRNSTLLGDSSGLAGLFRISTALFKSCPVILLVWWPNNPQLCSDP